MASNNVRLAIAAGMLFAAASALAGRVADVRNTPHNLSATGPGTVKATSESQVCVFCHTPHAATQGVTPLWNRRLSNQTYTVYTSSSLDANAIQGQLDQPGGSSKLCLSCHDGTLAIGNVNVLNGQANASITMGGTGSGGVMPSGSGTTSGCTRNIGADLTNDHPISVTYTNALATRDGELRALDANQRSPAGTGSLIGVRASGAKPQIPLEATGTDGAGQVQCATCHDPHIRETSTAVGNQKFLRMNRFQETDPPTATLNTNTGTSGDIICLACHEKNGPSGAWAYSAHANPLVASNRYKGTATDPTTPAGMRQFPTDLPVWKASCLNCHDAHTVQGARRLLREGTDGPKTATTPRQGGNSAIEETCYQCHTTSAESIVGTSSAGLLPPDIKTDFGRAIRMPITGTETHDIAGNFSDAFIDCSGPSNKCGADMLERRAQLLTRHAECTDCHNPHRVVKFQSGIRASLVGTPDKSGTHRHEDASGYVHSNLISGVLRGAWGVEPVYTNSSFQQMPTSFLIKRGDPGTNTDTSVEAAYVTREYQICLKCHSNYGYADDNVYPNSAMRPQLGGTGTTPVNRTNDPRTHTSFTNQAKEFQAPIGHQGQPGSTSDSGASSGYETNNHRSWHPVIASTGRTTAVRGGLGSGNWRLPWSNAVGTQTMYCSDCHGSNVTSGTSVRPDNNANTEDGNPWGPHGSSNDFLLKGVWNTSTGSGQEGTGLCFKCHSPSVYAPTDGGGARTGFWIGSSSSRGSGKDGHYIHSGRDKLSRSRCNWCHVAVPHGWKNKALLVNLQDVGPEAGQAAGTVIANGSLPYTNGPYYRNAMLKIKSFRPSGDWWIQSCGATGQDSRTWMQNTCGSPP